MKKINKKNKLLLSLFSVAILSPITIVACENKKQKEIKKTDSKGETPKGAQGGNDAPSVVESEADASTVSAQG